MIWNENFTSIVREKGYKIIWNQEEIRGDIGDSASTNTDDVDIKVEVMKNGKIESMDLNHFLEDECEESLHEFI